MTMRVAVARQAIFGVGRLEAKADKAPVSTREAEPEKVSKV
jgi:hypothetical protein